MAPQKAATPNEGCLHAGPRVQSVDRQGGEGRHERSHEEHQYDLRSCRFGACRSLTKILRNISSHKMAPAQQLTLVGLVRLMRLVRKGSRFGVGGSGSSQTRRRRSLLQKKGLVIRPFRCRYIPPFRDFFCLGLASDGEVQPASAVWQVVQLIREERIWQPGVGGGGWFLSLSVRAIQALFAFLFIVSPKSCSAPQEAARQDALASQAPFVVRCTNTV